MPTGPRRLLRVLLAVAIAGCFWLVLQRPAGGQETCNAEGACTIPPVTIERAEPTLYQPGYTG